MRIVARHSGVLVLSDDVLLFFDLSHLVYLRRKEVDAATLVVLLAVLAEAALIEKEVLAAILAVGDGLEEVVASAAGVKVAIPVEDMIDAKETQ